MHLQRRWPQVPPPKEGLSQVVQDFFHHVFFMTLDLDVKSMDVFEVCG